MEKLKKSKDASVSSASESDAIGPVKVFRQDDVSVSIFSRARVVKGENVIFYSASFSRSYKDPTGSWKYTKNFDSEDLGKVMALAKQASEFIDSERGLTATDGED